MINLTLIAMRHGDAATSTFNTKDFDRPLTTKGKEEVSSVATQLKLRGISPDIIIASTAIRTKETTAIAAQILNSEKTEIRYLDKLYLCPPESIDDIIASFSNITMEISILVIGHNPGLSTFVGDKLSNSNLFLGLNTSNAAILRFQIDKLTSVYSANATLENIIKPLNKNC